MELLLVCPQGFDYPPEVVAEKMCELPCLRPAPSELIISSDCLAFASAFQTQLGSRLVVNYSWDDRHTEAKTEPARIEAVYQGDVWYGRDTDESFGSRLWNSIETQNTAKRVVLCGQSTISTISRTSQLSICNLAVQSNDYPLVLQAVKFEEMQQLFKSLEPSAAAQALASIVATSVIAALRDKKSANVSFQPYLTSILTEQLRVAMDRLEEHYNQQISTAVEAVRAKQSEYCSTITRLSEHLQELEISQKEVGDMVNTFRSVPIEQRAVGVPGALDPQLPQIAKAIEQHENSIKILYEEVQHRKASTHPLKLTVSPGSCNVENRKRYELQNLELLYSGDASSFQALLNFTAPAGQSTLHFPMPQVATRITFVIRQNGRDVCDLVQWRAQLPPPPPLSS